MIIISMPRTFILFTFLLLLATYCLAEEEEEHNKASISATADQKDVPEKIDCGAACTARCRLSSRPHLCERACGTCCARCDCVPPGTSGNEDVCPCYANMTTHGGRHKCP